MKKITAVILSLIMLLVPLSGIALAADGDAASSFDASAITGLISGPLDSVKSLLQPLLDIFNKIKALVVKVLNSMGYYAGTGGDDFVRRQWQVDDTSQLVYAGLIQEFNDIIAVNAASNDECMIDKSIRSTYTVTAGSNGVVFNATTVQLIKSACPENVNTRVFTKDEGVRISDYLVPICGSIDMSKVKKGDRQNNYDGTSSIVLTLYNETYDNTSELAQTIVDKGFVQKSNFDNPIFSTRDFQGHNKDTVIKLTFDTDTQKVLTESVYIYGSYDICGTAALTESQQSTGWAYYDVNSYIDTVFTWQ